MGNPASRHAEAFRIAREAGLGITVHAGEADGPEAQIGARGVEGLPHRHCLIARDE
ncbi:MAG: hypothetical protein ACO3CU_06750 [Candidatus Nanopelagicales bacterium]